MKSCFVVLFAILGIAHVNGKPKNIINDEMRSELLDMHNNYRSQLAEGLIVTEKGEAGPAAKMIKMVYGKKLEKSAFESAAKCRSYASSSAAYDENLHVAHDEDFIQEALSEWFGEIYEKAQEETASVYSPSYNSYANMAWDTRKRVGCAIVECTGKIHVVCHYPPIANKEGQKIYEKGAKCSKCGSYGSGFKCVEGLCTK
ncbi:SCP-like protein [Ancylostoma caninum]|uniref:SCP-like protein n=1 Tax=Ancylostoma caninum TaxID=29170 RepID=A0A368H1Z9_ANCCA|nr:SCP-like protein [Ancylostoma caninum]